MGKGVLNPYSAGIDFSRQNLTPTGCKNQHICNGRRHNIGIQMNQKGIHEDFKLKKIPLVAMFFTNNFSALRARH